MTEETKDITAEGEETVTEYGSTSQTSGEKRIELDEIYRMIGLGPSQYLYWLLTSLLAYYDFAEITLLSVIVPLLRCEWGLTSTFEAAITIASYGSYVVFSVLFGKVADKYGRKTVIQWSTLLVILGAIGGALSPNIWVFLVTRLVTGACIGTNYSSSVCYCTEFAESKYRAYGMSTWVLPAFVGLAAINGLAFLILETVGWRWFIMIISIPSVPALILIFVLPESPRYLCVSGQQDKAMQAVRFMAKLNKKVLPENIRMICFDDEDLGSYAMILNEDHRKSTITLSLVYFSNIFIEFGLIMFLPLLYSSHFCGASPSITHKCQILTKKDLFQLTIATAGSIVGSLAGLLSAQFIGRLVPIRVAVLVTFLSLASLLLCVNDTFTLATTTVAKIGEAFTNTVVWIMIPESFPTSIRSTASGFINAWGKFGGVLGNACVYLLFYVSPFSVIGLFVFICFVGFVAIMIYDRETRYEVLKEI